MTIKILGPGCMNCKTLERRTIEALEKLGIQATVDKVVDLDGISSYGVMRTPGLVIDEKLVWQGGVPTVEKIKQLITANVQVS
jgi:small redox-active disulfide protein 2